MSLRDRTNEQQPQKDRRALLMEWRKQARSRSGKADNTPSAATGIENLNSTPGSAPSSKAKRSRLSLGGLHSASGPSPSQRLRMTDYSPGLPPASGYSSGVDQPMGATQRFRLAKEMQRQQKEQQRRAVSAENEFTPISRPPSGISLNMNESVCDKSFSQESALSQASFIDDVDTSMRQRKINSRRMSIASGAKKMRRKSIAVSNSSFDRGLSQDSEGSTTSRYQESGAHNRSTPVAERNGKHLISVFELI